MYCRRPDTEPRVGEQTWNRATRSCSSFGDLPGTNYGKQGRRKRWVRWVVVSTSKIYRYTTIPTWIFERKKIDRLIYFDSYISDIEKNDLFCNSQQQFSWLPPPPPPALPNQNERVLSRRRISKWCNTRLEPTKIWTEGFNFQIYFRQNVLKKLTQYLNATWIICELENCK